MSDGSSRNGPIIGGGIRCAFPPYALLYEKLSEHIRMVTGLTVNSSRDLFDDIFDSIIVALDDRHLLTGEQ